MAYKRKDSYYFKAKSEGYKSRAAYKLLELNKKHNFIKKGFKVLDCGAAPGGWSQVSLQLTGKSGFVAAVDYEAVEGINEINFKFIQGDMKDEETINALLALTDNKYDTVLSDMAPKTTGIKLKDHADSVELAVLAFNFAKKVLKPGGCFVTKIFDGEDRQDYVKSLQADFKQVKTARPDATRKESYEMYVIASGYKGS